MEKFQKFFKFSSIFFRKKNKKSSQPPPPQPPPPSPPPPPPPPNINELLCDDILLSIFHHLPLGDLYRARNVCQHWRALIESVELRYNRDQLVIYQVKSNYNIHSYVRAHIRPQRDYVDDYDDPDYADIKYPIEVDNDNDKVDPEAQEIDLHDYDPSGDGDEEKEEAAADNDPKPQDIELTEPHKGHDDNGRGQDEVMMKPYHEDEEEEPEEDQPQVEIINIDTSCYRRFDPHHDDDDYYDDHFYYGTKIDSITMEEYDQKWYPKSVMQNLYVINVSKKYNKNLKEQIYDAHFVPSPSSFMMKMLGKIFSQHGNVRNLRLYHVILNHKFVSVLTKKLNKSSTTSTSSPQSSQLQQLESIYFKRCKFCSNIRDDLLKRKSFLQQLSNVKKIKFFSNIISTDDHHHHTANYDDNLLVEFFAENCTNLREFSFESSKTFTGGKLSLLPWQTIESISLEKCRELNDNMLAKELSQLLLKPDHHLTQGVAYRLKQFNLNQENSRWRLFPETLCTILCERYTSVRWHTLVLPAFIDSIGSGGCDGRGGVVCKEICDICGENYDDDGGDDDDDADHLYHHHHHHNPQSRPPCTVSKLNKLHLHGIVATSDTTPEQLSRFFYWFFSPTRPYENLHELILEYFIPNFDHNRAISHTLASVPNLRTLRLHHITIISNTSTLVNIAELKHLRVLVLKNVPINDRTLVKILQQCTALQSCTIIYQDYRDGIGDNKCYIRPFLQITKNVIIDTIRLFKKNANENANANNNNNIDGDDRYNNRNQTQSSSLSRQLKLTICGAVHIPSSLISTTMMLNSDQRQQLQCFNWNVWVPKNLCLEIISGKQTTQKKSTMMTTKKFNDWP